jgi:hypothetical protein
MSLNTRRTKLLTTNTTDNGESWRPAPNSPMFPRPVTPTRDRKDLEAEAKGPRSPRTQTSKSRTVVFRLVLCGCLGLLVWLWLGMSGFADSHHAAKV